MVNPQLLSSFSKLIQQKDLDIHETSSMFNGVCPIHSDADNPNGFALYKNTGKFYCYTNNCHLNFKNNSVGELLKHFNADCDCSHHVHSEQFAEIKSSYAEAPIYPFDYLNNLEEPEYFIDRGYNAGYLQKYKVKYCGPNHKTFPDRCVVPVFDDDYTKIIGMTARTIHEKCLVCECHHKKYEECLEKKYTANSSKWINSKNFIKTNHLYNSWCARLLVKGPLIIVEGPGDVWKLSQCQIYNSVAVFGSSISAKQIEAINKIDPEYLVVASDNDAAGNKLAEQICSIWGRKLFIARFENYLNDISDLTDKEVKEIFYDKNNWARWQKR